ncbi:Holliday junction resolvase-like protein [Terrimonas alba]|uniref:Holliday junction resolvase-like protein n=1 Tax=Terrimonas alba TaxID=3349636 RepID=UPI0035F2ADCC
MQKQVLEFYSALRQIFGVCPECDEIIRLSDGKLYQKQKPENDWKENIDREIYKLELLEEKIEEKIKTAREAAREAGRKAAKKIIRKIDPIFHPLGLDCNDCKVIFHPVDFVVFKGMNSTSGDCSIKELLLLDKNSKNGESLSVQKSIEKAIHNENYEWLTLRIENNGNIVEE